MAEESDLERTEPPSPRRLEKAREEGQVPQSRELMAFLVMAAAVGGFWGFGQWLAQRAGGIVSQGLTFERKAAFDPQAMIESFVSLSGEALLVAAPVFLLTLVAAIATPFVLGGWRFSPKALVPRASRMNPMQGIKRMASWHSLGELVKAILKALLVAGVILWIVSRERDRLFGLALQSVDAALPAFADLLVFAALALLAGLAVIAAIDVPFQLWRYYAGLRMTRQELKQELKELEGDPQLKARIRSQQRAMARKRMMAEVPKADVVVTNPTHYAVALRYDRERMNAPEVVAKGMNLVAEKIRSLAAEHRVPVLEAPPLARALYRHAEIGEQIPAALYTAVAEVLAYVYRLDQYLAAGSGTPPSPPERLSIPPGMDPGEPVESAGVAA